MIPMLARAQSWFALAREPDKENGKRVVDEPLSLMTRLG
jgi:hypothetical protein